MRIGFASDFHGRAAHYEQLSDLLGERKPDVMILGGDLFPDGGDEDPAGAQRQYVLESFLPLIDRWRAAQRDLCVLCINGNHDWTTSVAELAGSHGNDRIVLLDPGRPRHHRGINFLGFGLSPPSPFYLKDHERLDEASDDPPNTGGWVWDGDAAAIRGVTGKTHFEGHPTLVEELGAIPEVAPPWIFVCHAPPFDTKLDRLPGLGQPIGSKAVRWFIESRRPLCALHGHIHESPEVTGDYCDEVGGVLCVNPGQGRDRLHAVFFDSDDPRGTISHTVFR